MGIEVKDAIITEETSALNFTNEGGIDRYKPLPEKHYRQCGCSNNVSREWKKEGITYAYEKLVHMAESVPAFQSLIDPDHISFANRHV